MIQRIQTVYLALAFVVVGVLPFFFPLWTWDNGKPAYIMQIGAYNVLTGLSTALCVMGIMFYKNRKRQFVLGRLNMILNFVLLSLFIYRLLNLSGETPVVSEKGIGIFLPIIAIVLLALANKAIKKDEDLVKSADRLR